MLNISTILKEIGENESVCIYTDKPTRFSFGRILAFDEIDIALYAVSPNGVFDGIIIVPISDITRIEAGNSYTKKMSELTCKDEYLKFPFSFSENNIRRQILEISMRSGNILSIEVSHSGYDDATGIVEDIGSDCVKMVCIDNEGFVDGKSWVSIDDITQIAFMSDTEQIIQQLYDKRKI